MRVVLSVPHAPVAVTTTLVAACTGVVETLKLTAVVPAGTVTVAGTCTLGSLLCRFTVTPPASAPPVSVTVPFASNPPVSELVERLIPDTHGGIDVVTVIRVETGPQPPDDAVIVTSLADNTPLLLRRINARPPGGAGPVRWTVPVNVLPPLTAAADKLSEAMHAGPVSSLVP